VSDDGDISAVKKVKHSVLHLFMLGPKLINATTQKVGRRAA